MPYGDVYCVSVIRKSSYRQVKFSIVILECIYYVILNHIYCFGEIITKIDDMFACFKNYP